MPKRKLLFSDILAREDEAPKRIKTYKGIVANRVSPRVPSPASGTSYSLLESMLPQELLVYIVDMLDSDDYLRIQFVCSLFSAATRKQDGTLKTNVKTIFDVHAYAATMAKIEAGLRLSVKLDKLTCSRCGRRLGIWDRLSGFDTKRYKRFDCRRLCMNCDACDNPERVYNVNGAYWVKCDSCMTFYNLGHAFRGSHLSSIISGCLLDWVEEDFGINIAKHKLKHWFCRHCLKREIASELDHLDFPDDLPSDDDADPNHEVGNEEV